MGAHRFDLNRLANKAFRYTSRRPIVQSTTPRYVNSTPARTPFSFSHPATLSTSSPASTHTPMRPYPPVLPPVNPRNADGTRTQRLAALTCYRCSQTGHTSRDCDLRHDVRHMMLDEQDEFIQRIMANRDAAAAESTTSACTSEGTVVEREVDESDFIRSSG
jgi:hypothetical protein